MKRLLHMLIVLVLLGLAACGTTSPDVVSTTTQPAASPVPTTTSQPTATRAPTATLVPTAEATATTSATATASTPTEAVASPSPSTAATATSAAATDTPTASATDTPTTTSATATASAVAGTTPDGIAIRPDLPGTIAFERDGSIYSYRPGTGEVKVLIEDGRDMQFSRDGTQLAFVRDNGVFIAAADGSNERQVADQANARQPRWSDDSTKLAFTTVADRTSPGVGEIYTIELPSGQPRKIADGTGPAWAPDSKRIAYVTAPLADASIRRNELHLANWQGQNDWPVVRNLPANVPVIGVPGSQPPTSQLEHLMFDPVWSADGRLIYVPSFVLMQVETDFVILERADATNGGSTFLTEIRGGSEAYGSPNREAMVLTAGTARGDVQLLAQTLDPSADQQAYAWAASQDVAVYQAPAWAPTSNALASYRCDWQDFTRCDLVVFEPEQNEPVVLVPNVFNGAAIDLTAGVALAWGAQ